MSKECVAAESSLLGGMWSWPSSPNKTSGPHLAHMGWGMKRMQTFPSWIRSETVSLAGTCCRAWPSPALLRDTLTWKLLVHMDSTCSKQWEKQGEQQGSLYLSKLLPHTSVSSSSNTLEQGMLPVAAPSCRVPQIPGPSRCCTVCHGRAPMGTAPRSFSALP